MELRNPLRKRLDVHSFSKLLCSAEDQYGRRASGEGMMRWFPDTNALMHVGKLLDLIPRLVFVGNCFIFGL